jgi:hypothetical protein
VLCALLALFSEISEGEENSTLPRNGQGFLHLIRHPALSATNVKEKPRPAERPNGVLGFKPGTQHGLNGFDMREVKHRYLTQAPASG